MYQIPDIPKDISTSHKQKALIVCDEFKNEFKQCITSGYVNDKKRILPNKKVLEKYKNCGKISCYRCKHWYEYRPKNTWYKKVIHKVISRGNVIGKEVLIESIIGCN